MSAGDHGKARIDAAEEGLDFRDLRHLARGGEEFVEGARLRPCRA
jgi:hypothetical protein